MHEFTVKVSQQGWKIRDSTPMDGNCFFWAVSDQLTKVNLDLQTHDELRVAVVNFIRNLPQVLTLNSLTQDCINKLKMFESINILIIIIV